MCRSPEGGSLPPEEVEEARDLESHLRLPQGSGGKVRRLDFIWKMTRISDVEKRQDWREA